MVDEPASLTMAQLAERTGVAPGTLRMWGARYGFPQPERLPGRRHRYRREDAELIREALRLRDRGLSTAAAIARARARSELPPESIFAALRRNHPSLAAVAVRKRALLQVTRAIEDEYCAGGGGGLLIGAFQRERFYRQSERRWRELSRTAQLAIALADFERLRAAPSGPVEVPIGRQRALAREWVLVVDAPHAVACLAAWERPAAQAVSDGARDFELVWSFDPEVAHAAVRITLALVQRLAPELGARLPAAPTDPVPASDPALRFAGALAQRIVAYLAGTQGRSR